MVLNRNESLVVVVDVQPNFMKGCLQYEETLARIKFLVECANRLQVPVLATVQYPERMGGTEESLDELIDGVALAKLSFSCCGNEDFLQQVRDSGATQIVLVGCETHICICQTALDLLAVGVEVYLALDGITSRSEQANKIAVKRLRDSGAWVVHTESAVYEWLEAAGTDEFKDVLQIVKRYPIT
jgi:nicotinamidase-related amidase